eukprot:8029039-Pyramimonas_sp.AAC.2
MEVDPATADAAPAAKRQRFRVLTKPLNPPLVAHFLGARRAPPEGLGGVGGGFQLMNVECELTNVKVSTLMLRIMGRYDLPVTIPAGIASYISHLM